MDILSPLDIMLSYFESLFKQNNFRVAIGLRTYRYSKVMQMYFYGPVGVGVKRFISIGNSPKSMTAPVDL